MLFGSVLWGPSPRANSTSTQRGSKARGEWCRASPVLSCSSEKLCLQGRCKNLIAVRKAARGRGLGRELLKCALAFATGKGAKVIKLEVRPENQAAVHLYRSAGFREVGKVKDLQGPWLAMEKAL